MNFSSRFGASRNWSERKKPKPPEAMLKIKYLGKAEQNLATIGRMKSGDVFEGTPELFESLMKHAGDEYEKAPAAAKVTAPRGAKGDTIVPDAPAVVAKPLNPVVPQAKPAVAPVQPVSAGSDED